MPLIQWIVQNLRMGRGGGGPPIPATSKTTNAPLATANMLTYAGPTAELSVFVFQPRGPMVVSPLPRAQMSSAALPTAAMSVV